MVSGVGEMAGAGEGVCVGVRGCIGKLGVAVHQWWLEQGGAPRHRESGAGRRWQRQAVTTGGAAKDSCFENQRERRGDGCGGRKATWQWAAAHDGFPASVHVFTSAQNRIPVGESGILLHPFHYIQVSQCAHPQKRMWVGEL
jgi:hypothetical protein